MMNFASKLVNFDVGSSSDEEVEVSSRRRLRYSDCEAADDVLDYGDEAEDDVEADPFGGFVNAPAAPQQQQQQGAVPPPPPGAAAAPAPPPPPPGAAAAPRRAAGAPPPPVLRKYKDSKKKKKAVRVRKLNTNIVELPLGAALSVESSGAVMTGDPQFCIDCGAVFSSISKLAQGDDKTFSMEEDEDGMIDGSWTCEFCSCENFVSLDGGEIPAGASNDYLVSGSLNASSGSVDESFASGKGLTIFVVDISGSMCITSEVKGGKKLKGFERLQQKQRELNPQGEDQYLPGQARDVSYISRLQCVQAAVDHQIEMLSKTDPDCHVAVVTFNNEVCMIGDGIQSPVTIAGDKLYDYDQVLAAGQAFPTGVSVKEGGETLRSKVFSLTENGATALGPALLAAVGAASSIPGSTVVVCTDGMANCGVGTLEVEDAQLEEAEGFYDKVGALASSSGVVVNIVSIEGSDCRMEYLSAVADATGGKVTMVNPLKLVTEFASLLADPVVASQVNITFILHKGLYCVDTENPDEKKESSERPQFVKKRIGNVTADTVELFEYGIRRAVRKDESITSLPFQVQVRFRRQSDGLELIRVITETKEVTRDRESAEKNADLQVLGTHAAKQSATLAMAGEYSQARGYAFKAKEFLRKVKSNASSERAREEQETGYMNFKRNIFTMEETLQSAQRQEESEGLCLSDSEDEDDWDNDSADKELRQAKESAKLMKKKAKLQSRKKKRSDSTATNMYGFKHANAKALFSAKSSDTA